MYAIRSYYVPSPGIEYYLPLFHDQVATLFDYLPREATVALHHDVAHAIQGFWADVGSRYKLLGGDPERPLLPRNNFV